MHRTLAISFVALSFVAATPQVQAQARTQNDIALHVIGAAIGGGVFGVAGVLTRLALEDATKRRSDDASMQVGVPASATFVYSASSEDRSGVHYNKPCTSFDPGTGRLLSCGTPIDDPVVAGFGGTTFPTRQARRFATHAYPPHVRTAHRYRSPRIHVRPVHAFRGGHR